MDIRNDRRGFSAAEGCMFVAVGLFAVLLVAVLAIAVLRALNPPEPLPPPGRVSQATASRERPEIASYRSPVTSPATGSWRPVTGNQSEVSDA